MKSTKCLKLIHHRTFQSCDLCLYFTSPSKLIYLLHPRLFNKLNIKITMTITKVLIMIIMRMRIIRMLAVRRESYPVVVVALGRKPLRRKGNLKHVRVNTSINLIQKLALISSARILRILFSFLLATCCCLAPMYDRI